MVRVHSRAAAVHSARSSSKIAVTRKKKPYKIVLESITQEKKKLRSAVSFDDQAPPGYTFIPVGSPELTEHCKELCRRRGLEVHVVSAKPKNKATTDPEKLGYHVHRLGYHFPSEIVDEAVEWLGIELSHGRRRGSRTAGYTSRIARGLEKAGRTLRMQQNASVEQTEQQIAITMKDLFPKIPDEAVKAIVKHAFRKGSSRVGSSDLPLARKVQLAVLAHVRHNYTDYDKILKEKSWLEARASVEKPCLDKLLEWRGEDDDGTIEMEDEFREVIVLDDDDDDDSDNATTSGSEDNSREASVEIVSSQATARELEAPEPTNDYWMHTHYSRAGYRLPRILRPRRPAFGETVAYPAYASGATYVPGSAQPLAHSRPLHEYTPHSRSLGGPQALRVIEVEGRPRHDALPPPTSYRPQAEGAPQDNAHYIRIMGPVSEHRHRAPASRSRSLFHESNTPVLTRQANDRDARPLIPEDEVIPSIEKDDPAPSPHSTQYNHGNASPTKRQKVEYVPLQERSFMQASMGQSRRSALSDHRPALSGAHHRQVSRTEVIDLTSSPREPKSIYYPHTTYASRRLDAGPEQPHRPRIYTARDEIQGRVPAEHVLPVYRHPEPEPVRTHSPRAITVRHHAEPMAFDQTVHIRGEPIEGRNANREQYYRPEHISHRPNPHDSTGVAVATATSSFSHADERDHERSLPSKRNSGGEEIDPRERGWRQWVRGGNGLPPRSEPRQVGYYAAHSDSVGPPGRDPNPKLLERRRDVPMIAERVPYATSNPARQRHEDVIVIDSSPVRTQPRGPFEYPLSPRGYPIDHVPLTARSAYRQEEGMVAYRPT